MIKETFTCNCKTCGKPFQLTCYGIFSPLAEFLAWFPLAFHCFIYHSHTRISVLKSMWKYIFFTIIIFILCMLHALSYIFYPLYLLLDLLFD